jgi:hypothetical protein
MFVKLKTRPEYTAAPKREKPLLLFCIPMAANFLVVKKFGVAHDAVQLIGAMCTTRLKITDNATNRRGAIYRARIYRVLVAIMGRNELRPYMHNPMRMIRHNNKFTQSHPRKMIGNFPPTFFHHHPRRIQHHVAILNVTEQRLALVGADGDEIRAGFWIIVSVQTDGFAVMNIPVKCHITFLVMIVRARFIAP